MPKFGTSARLFGGYAADETVLRRHEPNAVWKAYAAGWVNAKDSNIATIRLVYEKDDQSIVVLGSTTKTGNQRVKTKLGPFDIFGTSGVPGDEEIPIIRLQAEKDAGVDGELDGWMMVIYKER